MKPVADPEWKDLVEDWQAEETAAPAPPLSEEVRRRIRRRAKLRSWGLVLLGVSEVVVSIGSVIWLWQNLLVRHRMVDYVGFAGILLLIAAALGLAFWNRRGVWWPAAESTRSFVDLSVERCRRRLRMLRVCPWFAAVEIAFLAAWGSWAFLSRAEPVPPEKWQALFGSLALFAVAILAWWIWYRRRTLSELAELEEMRRSLDGWE